MTNSEHIIISYSGGSAGDLFVKSSNGEELTELPKLWVAQPATLKGYEQKIRYGEQASLDSELDKIPYKFVNTHLLDEVIDRGTLVYNIVVTDTNIQHTIIYRQMQLQKLSIKIDNDVWFTTIKKHCMNKDYGSAADVWFAKAKTLWLERMEYRLQFDKVPKLNFNRLFESDFVDDLEKQGWQHNNELLRKNHKFWLESNHGFCYVRTRQFMAHKLSTMNWEQEEGWVTYVPS